MAQAAKTGHNRLRPTPKALEKALKDSADRARRMAEAFGLKVPGVAHTPAKPAVGNKPRLVPQSRNIET
jgi:uncharacterized protein YggE